MKQSLATTDFELEFKSTPQGTSTAGLTYPGVATTEDPKVAINGVAVCTASVTLVFTVANVCPQSFSGHAFVAGAGAVVASGINTKAGYLPVLREEDTGTCVGSWTNTSSGATVPCECSVEILDAGQEVVKSD